MRMCLMRDGKMAARLEVRFCSTAFLVMEAEAVEPALLPPGIRLPMQADHRLSMEEASSHWLGGRQLPDYREGLDELLIQAYGLESHRMGRMYHTQHTAAALSYYVSGFDRYYLTPERTESICYALEDIHFPALFLFPPCTEGMAEEIRHKKVAGGMAGRFAASPDFTVPSGCPSWWEWDGGGKYLAQKPGEKGLRVYREVMRPRFPSVEDGGIVYTDFSCLSGDVLWLSELIPYLKQGKGIWEQVVEFLRRIPGSGDALDVLMECEAAAEKCGGMIAWSEMGISCGECGAEPVVIL